jgi:hypothetical protein
MRHLKYLVLVFLAACGGSESEVNGTELVGAAEGGEYAPLGVDGSTTLAVSTRLSVGAPVNLREAPSQDARLVMILPEGATVTVVERATPENGYYRVSYLGRLGWAYGAYLAPEVGSVSSALTELQRDNIMERAHRADGYSYWWGHGKFGCGLGKGNCSGSCPSCSHTGEGGADCSGLAAKAWAVPPSAPGTCVDGHPYSSTTFATESYYWRTIDWSNKERADALVLRGGGHIMIKGAGENANGCKWVVECRGCSYGCLANYHCVSSTDYKAIRRDENL